MTCARYLWTALAGVAVLLAGAVPAFAAEAKPHHVRGTIESVDTGTLTVKTRDGRSVKMTVKEDARVSGLAAIDLAKIEKGFYIGTAAVPDADGTLRAQEVLVFPPAMRGVGEGHRPWDISPDSTMTNASVDLVVDGVKGRELSLVYKGGAKKLVVPKGTPVVTIVPAGRDKLVPGAHIFAVATGSPEAGFTASRISVGLNGLTPPM